MLITTKPFKLSKNAKRTTQLFTFVELEFVGENVLSKPYFAVGVEQVLIQIVCDSSSELNLSQHVSDRIPRNTLTPKLDHELAVKLFSVILIQA